MGVPKALSVPSPIILYYPQRNGCKTRPPNYRKGFVSSVVATYIGRKMDGGLGLLSVFFMSNEESVSYLSVYK